MQRQEIFRLYKVAAVPVHSGGMGLGCMNSVHLAAFPASMVAVSSYLAKAYPSWIQINNEGDEVRVVEDLEPFTRDQIMNSVNIIKQKVPQGALQGLDSLSAIFQQFFVGASHLQNQQQEQVQDQNVLYGLAGKISKGGLLQSRIYNDLVKNLGLSLHQELKNKADEQATRDSDEGVRFRVFLSLQNYTSGMWLKRCAFS